MSQDPGAVLQRGAELLGKSPVLGQVAQLSKPLTAAGKAAATGAVSKGIDSVGDRIRHRADALRGSSEQAEPEKAEPEKPAAQDEDEKAAGRAAEVGETEPSGRDEAAAEDEEAEVTDEYEEGEEEPEEEEPEEESEAPAAQRRPSERSDDRSASAAAPRRRPAQEDLDEGRRRIRRPDRERSAAGGTPVRRRAGQS
jgi:hypothetical protein